MPALKITLKKSLIGYEKSQGKTAHALGLNKVGSSIVQPDNGAVRGMISKLEHVVVVETLAGDPPGKRRNIGKASAPAAAAEAKTEKAEAKPAARTRRAKASDAATE